MRRRFLRRRLVAVAFASLVAVGLTGCVYSGYVLPPPSVTSTTTTTAVPNGQLNCTPSPHSCGFADSTNTGILPGATLTLITSTSTAGSGWTCNSPCTSFHITASLGDTTHGFELSDHITAWVDRPNVTVTNLMVDGAHGENTYALEVCGSAASGPCSGTAANNFTIRNCDLIGAPDSTANVSSPLRGNAGVLTYPGQTNITVDHCHMHGFGTGGGLYIEQQKGAVVFTNSFVNHENCWDSTHNISCPASDSLYGSAYTDHTNAWHSGGGPGLDTTSSLLIRNNTLLNDFTACCQTTALSLFNDSGTTKRQKNINGLIDHNLIAAAGGFCFELQDQHNVTVTYLKMKQNHFSTRFNAECGAAGIDYNGVNLNSNGGVGNAQCANLWDDGAFAGSGADQSNVYPTSRQPVTANTC